MHQKVTIQNITLKGEGVARIDGKVVFVPGALPGETVTINPVVDKKSFMRAELVSVDEPADDRIDAKCVHDHECGGCSFWHTSTPFEHKFQAAVETIARVGGWRGDITPIPAPKDTDWRERVTLHAKDEQVGYFKDGTHDLFELKKCEVMHPALRKIVEQLDVRGRNNGSLFLELADESSVHLTATGGLDAHGKFPRKMEGLGGQTIGRRKRDDRSVTVKLETRTNHEVSIPSGLFRQANSEMNKKLVEFATKLMKAEDVVAEYFCGYGNLSFPVAQNVASIHGFEADQVAISTAKGIAKTHDFSNTRFDVQDLFINPSVPKKSTVALLDPPRAGAAAVCQKIAKSHLSRVVYISCDPATFARDLKELTASGFSVVECEILDMFPRTAHVEVACYLTR